LKLNIGMGFEKQPNGRPLLRIEPIAYFQQSNPSANLYDQPDIEMKFDTARLYASVNFGAEPYLFPNECNNGDGFCLFPQPVFRGFRDETFGFLGECNTSNVLKLKTSDVVFDTNVIENILQYNSEDYELSPIVIQSDYYSQFAPNSFSARVYNLPGLTIPFYNLNFNNEGVSGNWISGYPNSLQAFFDPTQTPFSATVFVTPVQSWEIINTTATSFSDYNGVFPDWNNELNDPGNNLLGQYYLIPFNGVYSFSVAFLLDQLSGNFGNRTIIAQIKRYQPDGSAVIQLVNGTPVTGNVNLLATATATFYCNQGDRIYTDVTGASTVGPQVMRILSGFANTTLFSGSGANFQEPELQPVDINDVQAYLYKFKRPLSMAEINAIASETSKPIQLGRKDDSIAVIDTYIKNIQIESVMRKNAQFELRSNKLLP
jgi:hypothetical protein